jgi:type IV pilus assembly protein PilY1
LQARAVTNGSVSNTVVWKAEDVLPAWNSRNIVTWNKDSKKAVEFKWDKLSNEQKTYLANNNVLEYLRGNDALERAKAGGYMRDRATKLGDIVNSSPVFVQQNYEAYQMLPGSASEGASYLAFYKAKAGRTPMLYVGANDGMLHAFNADTGIETFAYVPNSVYPFMKALTEPSYTHHYMVDGQLVEGDAYSTTDSAWHTLLLGSTGAGAKSVFALDVTKPTANGANALAAANVLWEKDSSDLPDLGYQLGKPTVVRMRDGSWVSIFSNGYGSGTNKSVLYILNAFTGAVIRTIETNTNSGAANGLSTPALLFNNQRELVAAYAGDLQGNMWKFDLSATTASGWKVALGGSPLYVAKDSTPAKAAQSIVVRPAIGFHPKGGYMINFVTGKYFELGDGAISQLQTVYGVWDKTDIPNVVPDAITGERDTILQGQTLTADTETASLGGATLSTNTVDWKTKRGWYINLTLGTGERGVGEPFITDDTTLWISTLDPVSDPCSSGGVSRLMGFDYVSGGNGDSPLFDVNNDGVIDSKDKKIAVIKTGGTVASTSTFKVPPPGQDPNSAEPVGCLGGKRKVVTNRLDGTTQETSISNKCLPPLRTWHEIEVGY